MIQTGTIFHFTYVKLTANDVTKLLTRWRHVFDQWTLFPQEGLFFDEIVSHDVVSCSPVNLGFHNHLSEATELFVNNTPSNWEVLLKRQCQLQIDKPWLLLVREQAQHRDTMITKFRWDLPPFGKLEISELNPHYCRCSNLQWQVAQLLHIMLFHGISARKAAGCCQLLPETRTGCVERIGDIEKTWSTMRISTLERSHMSQVARIVAMKKWTLYFWTSKQVTPSKLGTFTNREEKFFQLETYGGEMLGGKSRVLHNMYIYIYTCIDTYVYVYIHVYDICIHK